MANADAIYKTMSWVTDENLNMDHWAGSDRPRMTCNTTMCLAGHATVTAGKTLHWVLDEETGEYQASTTIDNHPVEEFAQEYLGLDYDQANELFYETPATTVDELWTAIERVAGVKRPSLVEA